MCYTQAARSSLDRSSCANLALPEHDASFELICKRVFYRAISNNTIRVGFGNKPVTNQSSQGQECVVTDTLLKSCCWNDHVHMISFSLVRCENYSNSDSNTVDMLSRTITAPTVNGTFYSLRCLHCHVSLVSTVLCFQILVSFRMS